MGGEGEGAGEFQFVREIRPLPGDSLLVFDYVGGSYSYLDPDGAFVRRVRILGFDRRLRTTTLLAREPDGSTLSTTLSLPAPSQVTGTVAASQTVVRHNRRGVVVDTLARFPGSDSWSFYPTPDEGVSFTLPFSPAPTVVATPNGFVIGDAARFELQYYDRAGSLHTIARAPFEPSPITDDDIDAYIGRSPAPPDRRAFARRAIEAAPLPSHHPAAQAMISGARGYVWVQRFERCVRPTGAGCLVTDGPTPWSVFDPTGRWLTDVDVPPDVVVEEIGEDYVLGLRWDADGVQYIVWFPLER